MAFIENRTTTSLAIPGPLDLFYIARKWYIRRQKRHEIAVLMNQPDWVLKDMGITHGDVHEALAQKGDASLHLRTLAAKRRLWNRGRSSL